MANNNRIVDKNDPKYVLALQFLNHILTNNNKPQIQDILEFKDITRQEILKQENLNIRYIVLISRSSRTSRST
jgi:hypothetical protein